MNRIVASARDGSIILFHFGGRGTIDLVTGVVRGLQQRGFCFVTLSELYGWKKMVRGGDSGPGAAAPSLRHVFAEGTTRPGFEEWLLVLNPNDVPVTVRAGYHAAGGSLEREYEIPARRRISVNVNGEVPWKDDVSMVLESSLPVVAERSVFFNRGANFGGGSVSRGAEECSRTWYFPEGSVKSGFEEYLAVFNPARETALLRVAFHGEGGEAGVVEREVGPLSRLTLRVNDRVPEGDYSAVVRSSEPVAVERSQYFLYGGFCAGSSCSPGTTRPAARHYFAEGTTRERFDSYLSLHNPCGHDTWVLVRMHVSDGSLREERLALGAGERRTMRLDTCLPPDRDYSLTVLSLLPVAVERSVYFLSHNLAGGFCDAGVREASGSWYFAEGSTRPGFTQWLAVFNPNARQEVARVTYICGEEAVEREYLIPPGQRVTVAVGSEVGERDEVAMVVSCDGGILAERSLYFDHAMP